MARDYLVEGRGCLKLLRGGVCIPLGGEGRWAASCRRCKMSLSPARVQIFRISCQLPLELIPGTIRMYFCAVIILCQELSAMQPVTGGNQTWVPETSPHLPTWLSRGAGYRVSCLPTQQGLHSDSASLQNPNVCASSAPRRDSAEPRPRGCSGLGEPRPALPSF